MPVRLITGPKHCRLTRPGRLIEHGNLLAAWQPRQPPACKRCGTQQLRRAFPAYSLESASMSPAISPVAALSTAALLLAACYLDRPRGWAAGDLIEVRQSQIANRGVFARRHLKPGTLLGVYPGRVRSEAAMLDKAAVVPCCKTYVFRTNGGRFMDPTDATGVVSDRPGPGMPWLAVNTALAFVNEPPPGRLTNVTIEDGKEDSEICFVTACEIESGEELCIDYGRTYDRSLYARPPEPPQQADNEDW